MQLLNRSIVQLFAVAGLAGISASLCGCAETASAVTAIEATKMTADILGSLPAWVQQASISFQLNNNVDWGKPEKIVITDTAYVLMYPTSPAQLKASNGIPRMIVINRSDAPNQTF
ncbi:hypothetical protein [Humisphaera borealis]|uniref:Uncharacterized protein n=1 Tax=Humisphaera borealis TaxID=2807512 RepID=A0A7M2X2S9_9BACT|nr:hypothetical protein [Humisphaera borealis]QOV92058.1 hypothetical protein IPV69_12165 [Humisphaera borealis]